MDWNEMNLTKLKNELIEKCDVEEENEKAENMK